MGWIDSQKQEEKNQKSALKWTREQLWNQAEAAEKRKDARIARKVELALPALNGTVVGEGLEYRCVKAGARKTFESRGNPHQKI